MLPLVSLIFVALLLLELILFGLLLDILPLVSFEADALILDVGICLA